MPSLFGSSGQTPVTADDVLRKKQLAELMMKRAVSPDQNAMASNSPLLAALVPLMSAFAANRAQGKATEAEKGLMGQRQEELAKIIAAGQGTKEQIGQTPFVDEQAQFMGQESPAGLVASEWPIPGKPGGRDAMLRAMIESSTPEFQKIGLSGMLDPGKQAEGFTLAPGQARFDSMGMPIAALPKDKTEDTDKKNAQAFDDSAKLRNEFINQSKDFKQVRDSYERIYESAQKPSAAGDLALIFNYMKMLDPGSTVREGEFANAQNAAGIPERVAAMYNNVIAGERLTENTRNDFLTRSDAMYEAQLRGQSQLEEVYKGLAQRSGFSPDNVVIDYRVKGKRPKKPEGTGPQVGEVMDGYRFKGGNPSDPNSWEQVQ